MGTQNETLNEDVDITRPLLLAIVSLLLACDYLPFIPLF